MFESADLLPPDAIFGLTEKFKNDPNENKISLTVGVYKDENGKTPLIKAVADAEKILADAKASKTYLPIDGRFGQMEIDSDPWRHRWLASGR